MSSTRGRGDPRGSLLALEVGLEGLANVGGDDHHVASLSLSIAATERDTGKTQRLDQRLSVDAGPGGGFEQWHFSSRELELPPGVAQARVVVRDESLGRLGSLTLRFVVPELSGPAFLHADPHRPAR